MFGVPQWSITCPLLFNIDTCDMFFEHISEEFSSDANEITLALYGSDHGSDSDYDMLLKELEDTISSVFFPL